MLRPVPSFDYRGDWGNSNGAPASSPGGGLRPASERRSPGGGLRPASRGSAKPAPASPPSGARHRPPQAAGRQGPPVRGGWLGFNRGRATRRQGNADLRSAQAAAGGRQTRTPTAAGMVRLRPGQSDAQARERRPLGSPPGGARHRPPQAAGRQGPRLRRWFGSQPGPRCSASSGRLRGTRLSPLRHLHPPATGRGSSCIRG